MKKPLDFRMYADVRFNRPVDMEKDSLSPGGYKMSINGESINIDFLESTSSLDEKDSNLVHIMHTRPDYETFPELKNLTVAMLDKIDCIDDFFVFTGEKGESDLVAISVEKIYFSIESGVRTGTIIALPYRVVSKATVNGAFSLADIKNKTLEETPETTCFKVKLPQGYLIVRKKGTEDDCPGVMITYSETGKMEDSGDVVTVVDWQTNLNKLMAKVNINVTDVIEFA